jgi:hypothetical protein
MSKGVFFACSYDTASSELVSDAIYMENIAAALEIMKPKPCPYPLIRLGGDIDGAYLIPDDLKNIDACFSPGVNNRKNFEDYLATRYGIKSHMCDYSSDENMLATQIIPDMQTFRKLWLEPASSETSIALQDWVNELSPDDDKDLFLQIDIEGAEYRNILSCDDNILARFRIISTEIHSLDSMANKSIFENIIFPFLKKIGSQFICVHAHPNNWEGEIILRPTGANVPRVLELTFLRKDRFAGVDTTKLEPPLIPHPDDITNAPAMAPLVLNDRWLDGPRPLASRLKIIEDELVYLRRKNDQLLTQFSGALEAAVVLPLRWAQTNRKTGGDGAAAILSETKLDEVAAGRKYVLSSGFAGTAKSGIVPLNPNNVFFFHTDFGPNQSVTIDIGQSRTIRKISVGNRRDACFDRARLLFAVLHQEPDPGQGSVYALEANQGFLKGAAPATTIIDPPVEARYVTICSPLITALHFSQIEIFAEPRSAGAETVGQAPVNS